MLSFENTESGNLRGTLKLIACAYSDTPGPIPSPDASYHTLLYVFKGCLSVRIREAEFNIGEGYAVVIRVGTPVELKDLSPGSAFAAVMFDAYGTWFFLPEDDSIAVRMPENGYLIQQMLHLSGEANGFIAAEALLTVVLYTVFSENRECPGTVCHADRVRAYIEDHITEPLTAENVSAALHYHPDYLNRIIRSGCGHTLKEYICTARLEYAKKLLAKTGMTNEAIARAMNFASASHFLKFFKYHAGITPSQYRNSLLNPEV